MIPGVSSNVGQNPAQASVNVTFPIDDIPEQRRQNANGTTLGMGNGPDSYTVHPGELVVYDRDACTPGCQPPVFSSLSGLRYNQRNGDAGLENRLVPVGVAVTLVHFKAASGLRSTKITVATNGLVAMHWKSPKIEHPMPGDLVCAYPPTTDRVERENQLKKVSNNSSGDRFQGDIERDNRIPMLMKRFDISQVDDLIVRALDKFAENPQAYVTGSKPDILTPEEMIIYDVLLTVTAISAGMTTKKFESFDSNEKIASVLAVFSTISTPTIEAQRLAFPAQTYTNLGKDEYFDKIADNQLSKLIDLLMVSMRTVIDRCYQSVIGRIVRPRIGGDVMIFLG